MIKGKDIYDVIAALVPLYVVLILAYGSIRWWKIFTPEQCSGINRFVAMFAVPFLSFHYISSNNPYTMNFKFLGADSLQKVVILIALFLWNTFTKWGSIDWTITFFALSTLPNTLIMGVPLLKAMYGDFTVSLMVQIVVFQSCIWNTLMLFMFEYRGAKKLISEQFPDNVGAIASLRVDSNVSSLNGIEPLQTGVEIGENGKLHMVVRSMSHSNMSMVSSLSKSYSTSLNLTGVEIYSVQSHIDQPTQRASSFDGINFYTSNLHFDEEMLNRKKIIWRSKSCRDEIFNNGGLDLSQKPMFLSSNKDIMSSGDGSAITNNELHMFVWSSSESPNSDGNPRHAVNRVAFADFGTIEPSKAIGVPHQISTSKGNRERRLENIEEGPKYPVMGSRKEVSIEEGNKNKKQQMPSVSIMARLILIMAWRNLIRNPNTYANVLGVTWSLIAYGWNIKMPSIVKDSISIMSNTGLGMSVFSLGLFMAVQPKIISCGKTQAAISMAIRFLVGPAVIAATSKAMAICGVLLHVAIVQAALPQGIIPFVFAKEYNLHADILSTGVIFGMVVALPVTIIYYVLLGL